MKRLVTILFAAALLAGGFAAPASADLADVGPVDPVTGFPLWFEDATGPPGLRLQLCDEFDPNNPILVEQPPCVPELIDPNLGFVDGNIGEALFYGVDGETDGPNLEFVRAQCVVEAAGGAPNIVGNAALINILDLVTPGDYSVTTPCGQFDFNHPADTDGGQFRAEIAVEGLPTDVPPFSGALGPNAPVQIFANNGTGAPGFLGSGAEGESGLLSSPLQPGGPTIVTITLDGAPFLTIEQFGVVGKVSGCTEDNEAPTTVDDLDVTTVETPVIIDVLANDSDLVVTDPTAVPPVTEIITPAVGTVTIVADSILPVGSGTATANPDGTVTFTPAVGFSGMASFQYNAVDPCGLISLQPATATILVEDLLVDEADYRVRTGKWELAGSSNFSDLTVTEAGVTTFLSVLTGAQEVPSNQSLSKGFATVSMAEVTPTTLDISVRVDPLPVSAITAAHIHTPAGIGVNAPAVVDICGTATTDPCTPVNGQLIVELVGVAADAATITAIQNGNAYINVHTVDIPGGEIRGQLGVNVISLRSGADGTGPAIGAAEVQAGGLLWSFDGRAATSPGAAPYSIHTESGLGNTETRTLRLR